MLHASLSKPRRVLLTLDAVGGVWRYSIDIARRLSEAGMDILLVGQGPYPNTRQQSELARLPQVELQWLDEPLDWMTHCESDIADVPRHLSSLADRWKADILHLNLPSQAAGLETERAVLVVSHSCVATWWDAVHHSHLPLYLGWHHRVNRTGFDRADVVTAPSASHAASLVRTYGQIERLRVVPNCIDGPALIQPKRPFALAAGRWWDAGKNGVRLDAAASQTNWTVTMAGSCTSPGGDNVILRHAHVLGELAASDLRQMMCQAAIFIAPSLYEPFGLAPMEAARARCALILSDIPTFREIWTDAAIFIDPLSPIDMATAINRLSADRALRDVMAERAHRRSLAFTQDHHTRLLLNAYQQAFLGTQDRMSSVA